MWEGHTGDHGKGKQWRRDLELIRGLGLEDFRYPIPWHRIEKKPGDYCWRALDPVIAYATELNLSIIADPLHHTSYPSWLKDGFANPDFPKLYIRFVRAFAECYPEVTTYTPFNEPGCILDSAGTGAVGIPITRATPRT